MESFIWFALWLMIACGVLAIAWLFAGVSVPQRDYSDDWRADL